MPRQTVTMFHPKAGTMQCAPKAVRIHQRQGWEVVDGPEPVAVSAAGGTDVLTTGTVFPPETFDEAREEPTKPARSRKTTDDS